MAADEEARHRLHSRLDDVLGAEEAAALMTSVPPYPWPELATKSDLVALEERLDFKLATLKHELLSEMHRTVNEAVNRMVLAVIVAMIGTVLAATSLALAATRLV